MDKIKFDEDEDSDLTHRSYNSQAEDGGGDFWEEIETKLNFQIPAALD